MILELRPRKGGGRWDEPDSDARGFGMNEAILEAGMDLVVHHKPQYGLNLTATFKFGE